MSLPWRRSMKRHDLDARVYFESVVANVGQLYSASYDEATTKKKLNDAFVSAKDLGVWNALIDWGIFCGVGNLNGVLVKAKNTTGSPFLTNNNFVEGDYASNGAAPGLAGRASCYLSTGLTGTALSQDDVSLGLFVTNPNQASIVQAPIGLDSTAAGALNFVKSSGGGMVARVFPSFSGGVTLGTVSGTTKGLVGASRNISTTIKTFFPGDVSPVDRASTSGAPLNLAVSVMARGAGQDPFLSRVSSYWFGRAVDLSAMKTVLDNLSTSFGFTP